MSAAMDNSEIAVKETERSEDYKSPGRLKAEEKAEKARYAEEYKRKLEVDDTASLPKKTKAAEQKEQEKMELAEREFSERKAQLDEKTSEASQRMADAIERIEALKDKIERTEIELAAAKKDVESVDPDAQMSEAPAKIQNVTIKLPVASFTAPYAVKRKQVRHVESVEQQPPQQPRDAQPMYYSPAVMQYLIMTPPPPSTAPAMSRSPRFNFVTPPTPSKPANSYKSKPNVQPIDVTERFGKGDINKPAVAYGGSLSGAVWDDDRSINTLVFTPIDADDFDISSAGDGEIS